MRWGWISSNPGDVAKKPRQPEPQPDPPTVEQASRIVTAAWGQDDDWGTLVWLVMVTGLRRAELLGLRWHRVDLPAGMLTIRRNYVRAAGELLEKDTKTHQMRRISLDPATVEVLTEHRQRYEELARQLQIEPCDDAYLFSHKPARDVPYDPDGITHRYSKMCRELGIDRHLQALRHYSATELLSPGVDLRTVAGRLGHGGGGATTLRVYAAWVNESDRRAAEILGSRLQRPPTRGVGDGLAGCPVLSSVGRHGGRIARRRGGGRTPGNRLSGHAQVEAIPCRSTCHAVGKVRACGYERRTSGSGPASARTVDERRHC